MKNTLPDTILFQLSEFIALNLALNFPKEKWIDLERNIILAAKEFGFDDVETFVRHIISKPLSRVDSEKLASFLTINETYFWRESQAFEALEQKVLPEIIKMRKKEEKRIRIWSAGCSTGEEPYSIAIAISRLIPDIDQWNITILANDINPKMLQKASIGEYSQWSFRGVPQWLKSNYFIQKENGKFEIVPAIKNMVRFEYLNLAEDVFPSPLNNTNAMDIIFCRNVLMYFKQNRIKQVLHGLYNSLIHDGYLVLSASEFSLQNDTEFSAVNFPGMIFYQKTLKKHKRQKTTPLIEIDYKPIVFESPLQVPEIVEKTEPVEKEPEYKVIPKTELKLNKNPIYEEAILLYSQGKYSEVIDKLQKEVFTSDEYILLIRAFANQGKLNDAISFCENAIGADKINPGLHYLYATILQENNQISEAIASHKRAMYMDSDFILSYFSLGNIYRQQGNIRNARKNYEIVLNILNKIKQDVIFPEFEGITIGRFKEIINSYLQHSI
jgi:chemotaxis protein methyltransferase CheR